MFIASEAGVPWVSTGGRKVGIALRVLCNELRHKAWLVITLPPAAQYIHVDQARKSHPWTRKNSSFLHPHLSCFAASFVNIFSPFMFQSFSYFFIWFTCFSFIHIQNSINSTYTYSYTFQSFEQLFILVYISSRISSLVRRFYFGASFVFSPRVRPPSRCCVPHYRLLLTRLLFFLSSFHFVFRFFPLTFSSLFFSGNRMELPAISQRWSTASHSFKNLYYRPLFSPFPKEFFSPKANHPSSSGSSVAIYFYIFPLPSDISTAIKETKHHYVVPLPVCPACFRHKTIPEIYQ